MKATLVLLALVFAAVIYADTKVIQVGAGNGFQFDPSTINIAEGDTVSFEWVSSGHNVVSGSSCGSPDNEFTSGSSLFDNGSSYNITFKKSGTFNYYCNPHCSIGMKGKIVVGSGSSSASSVAPLALLVGGVAAIVLL